MIIGIDIRNIGKNRTGDEVVFFNLVKNLQEIVREKKQDECDFRLFTDITDKEKLKEIESDLGITKGDGFEIISLKSKNRFAWNFWTLPNYLRKNPVDVYHTQYITPFFVPRKIKIITTIHDVSFKVHKEFIKFSDLFFLSILIPLSFRRADKIIAVSQFTKDEIVKHYGVEEKKVEVVYNSVSDNFRKEISESDLAKVRGKYQLPEDFVMYLGTMQPRKNIPTIIGAFAKMKKKIPNAKLVLVGNRKAHNFDLKIDKIIQRENLQEDVIFPGYVDEEDKPAIFRLTKVFAFLSSYEGFGIPALEAMSQGVPVLASDIPVLREVGGKGCIFADIGDLDEISKKMYNLFIDNNQRKDVLLLGKEQLKNFSWKKSAEKLLSIYQKML
jgi:glycosyltransferase involved in cell wall biosynthesis